MAGEDRPLRFVFSGVYDLPFGKGKRVAGSVGPWTDRLVGGWQVAAIYSLQSGAPVGFGNVIFRGGDLDFDASNINRAFDVQLRAEAFHLANHPIFNAPQVNPTSNDFGRITSQANLPRTVQLALRVTF
ncbi:MAG: hypothetical protein HY820_23335 [Acidobacteria bacterium]|nr:hypothetical protein [Acidobacteriota bacterium]